MKNFWAQIRQYPIPYIAMATAMAILLIAFQFNWAYTNNFWGDIGLRIGAGAVIGAIIGLGYARLLLITLKKLTGLADDFLLKKSILLHAPFTAFALVSAMPQHAGLFFAIGGAGYVGLLWWLFIFPQEKNIKNNIAANAPFFLTLIGTIAALAARKVLIPQVSMDTANWVMPWLNYIQQHGFAAYADTFNNYAPFYSYLLGIFSWLPLSDLEIIKYISIAFDLMAAYYIRQMVKLRFPNSPMLPVLAFVSFLFLPTILINSSFWGQCDIIYVAFSLAALYHLMLPDTRKNNLWSVALYALALSVKLQAMLIAPIFAIAWFKRDMRLSDFLLIPATYLAFMVPCLIAGRGFKDLLLVYFTIVDKNPVLTENSPNIYQLVNYNFMFNNAGVLVAFAVQAIIIFAVVWKLRGKELSMDILAHAAFLITLTMPFLLPRMHERYFLLAESISLLFAFYNPRYFYLPLALGFISFFTYTEFLFAFVLVPFHWLTLAVLVLILIVGGLLLNKLNNKTIAD